MKFKKITGIILAMVMVMSIPHISLAAVTPGGFPDIDDSDHVHAISYLKALGVLKGDGGTGNFRPDHFLTRQEFAVITARIGDPIPGIDITVNQRAGDPIPDIDITVNQRAGDPIPGIDITVNQSPGSVMPSSALPYTDNDVIADWAHDSIAAVTEYGWIKGYEDGSFGPANNLTYAEAVTVLLRVLGYEDTIDKGQWPAAYIAKAEELEMNAGVNSAHDSVITRAEMAQLTYNTLFISRLNSIQFYVGDLDSDGDGYGDTITGYNEIISPSGQPVELWKYLQEIKNLTSELTEAEEMERDSLATGESTPNSEQRLADLKKLADELVNIYELSQDVVLIGADKLEELIGTLIRVTFNEDGQIFIIEAGSAAIK